jgi:hypothetical protein
MPRALLFALLLVPLSAAAPVPKSVKAKTFDPSGKWVTAERVNRGEVVKEEWIWEISGEALVTFSQSRGVLHRTHQGADTSFVRPEEAKPDEFDYRYKSGQTNLVYRGRVKWDGDEWVFCFAEAGADRPAEVKAGKDVYYLRFKKLADK